MFYNDIFDIIKNYEVKGSKFGLSRTRKLLDGLGSPDKKLKNIHVAGSNGKGSVCAYISHILKAEGKAVGTFTSPEVYSYGEKFLIGCKPIDEQKLKKYLSEAYSLSLTFEDKPTAFEVECAAALYAFASEGCEYAVIECGMGGLNDATNAIAGKAVAVITSVSLEHTAILGDTITAICTQKAGIIKNCPAVFSRLQSEEGYNFFKNLGAQPAGEGLKILSTSIEGQTFCYGGQTYNIQMCGEAQAYNATVAIEVAKLLNISQNSIATGLQRTKLLGRVELIHGKNADYILDGSHNPASFAPLMDIIKSDSRKKQLVFSCLADKDVETATNILCEGFDEVFIFPSSSYRAMQLPRIYAAFNGKCARVEECASIAECLQKTNAPLVVVCGTFTILKEAKEWIGKGL